MKKTNLLLALATTLVATSCSQDVIQEPTIPDSEKTKIEFSMSDAGGVLSSSGMTRAGFTGFSDGVYSSEVKTQIIARFSSTDGTNTRHTRTVLTADPDTTAYSGNDYNMGSVSKVDYSQASNKRYWDDAYGRAAKISVYAIAVPNKSNVSNKNIDGTSKTLEEKLVIDASKKVSTNIPDWYTDTENDVVEWTVTDENIQTTALINAEDLCYSNNIQKEEGVYGKDGRRVWGTHDEGDRDTYNYPEYKYDGSATDKYPTLDNGELIFTPVTSGEPTGPGHFDRGHMIFNHALSRISIELYAGEGFNMSENGKFTMQNAGESSVASIDLLKMPVKGKLNIKTGSWSDTSTGEHTYMSCSAKSTSVTEANKATVPVYSLTAQVIPGFTFADASNTNVLTFSIDGNAYYVTKDQIFDALKDGDLSTASGSIVMEPGKHYKFKLTVGKTGIKNLTCSLIDWVDINASFVAKNAYITLNLLKDGNACDSFDIYRLLNENLTVTTPTNTLFDGNNEHMKGWVDANDKLSTKTSGGVTKNDNYSTSKSWTTSWFFDTNKSFYHFRTVNVGLSLTKDETIGDFFTMYSGPINNTVSETFPSSVGEDKYNDYHWGATFNQYSTDGKPGYLNYNETTGFESKLSKPIGPTLDEISIVEQHMMANIKVVLLTPTKEDGTLAADAITLYDPSKTGTGQRIVSDVQISNYAGSATVRLGNGLITPKTISSASDASTSSMTQPERNSNNTYDADFGSTDGQKYYLQSKTYQFGGTGTKYYASKEYSWRVVPQNLSRGDGASNKVGITILTPDDNMYYCVEDLSKIKPSSITGNDMKGDHKTNDYITRWNPGYTYVYYFKLTKTGIKLLTCSIVDWVTVNANPMDITLEN